MWQIEIHAHLRFLSSLFIFHSWHDWDSQLSPCCLPRVRIGSKMSLKIIVPKKYGVYSLYGTFFILVTKISLPQIKVWEYNTRSLNVAISPTSGHTIQPAHVNSVSAPKRSRKNHSCEKVKRTLIRKE